MVPICFWSRKLSNTLALVPRPSTGLRVHSMVAMTLIDDRFMFMFMFMFAFSRNFPEYRHTSGKIRISLRSLVSRPSTGLRVRSMVMVAMTLMIVSCLCCSHFPGNFLNGGTPRGGAYGFKVDVLKKFSELKV